MIREYRVIIFGVFSAGSMEQELTPEMNMPMMIVQTTYIGAGPEDVEKLISSKIEGAIGSLSGVKNVSSTSMDNVSIVMLQYEFGIDMDTAYIDLMEKINRISGTLPKNADSPVVMAMDMNAGNSVTLSVNSESHQNLLDYVEQKIVPDFEKLSTVADVSVSGGQEQYIKVELLEEKLKQYGITMTNVISSLASADFSMPNGSVNYGSQSTSVRSAVEYKSTESLKNIPVSISGGGSIRLADVANIYDAYKESDSISRYNGNDNITIGIQKRQSSSAVSVSKQVMAVVEQLKISDSSISIQVVNDQKDSIQSSIMSVVVTLILGILISMGVLLLFLGDMRASLIVGSSMPVSLLISLILMKFQGFTLNIVTLSAMVMGVGMMVDNSIVVLDSIFKCDNRKKTPQEAAVEGTKFVMNYIIGSTLTTVVVFLPIAVLKGIAGQMLGPLGYTIVYSLTASLFSAITLLPLFFVQFKPKENRKAPAALLLKKLELGYGRLLKRILYKKKTIMAISLAFIAVSVFLATQLNVELLTSNDEGAVSIDVEMRPGLRLEKENEIMLQLEEIVNAHPDVDRYITTINSGGNITAYLKDKRKMKTSEVVDQWRLESKDVLDCNISIIAATATSGLMSTDAQINLKGNDLTALREFGKEVEGVFQAHPDILSVSGDLKSGSPQAEIIVDPIKASALGLTPALVSNNVGMALSGVEATTISRNGNDYAIRVEYPSGRYEDMTNLESMIIVSPAGVSVPLTDIASIKLSNAPVTITRQDNQYIITISGTPKASAKFTAQKEITAQVKALQFPDGIELANSSASDMQTDEIGGIMMALIAAILLVFLVMTIQFESFKHALMVMICIPFSLIGSFSFLFLARATIGMVSLLGFLVLIGTVVNNGILFVDTTNEYRKSMDLQTALINTGRHRLRPILMTTLTTVLSMIPLAMGIGKGSEMMQGLGIVVIGGLTASTILTLLLLPTFYLIIDGNPEKKQRREGKRRARKEKRELITK